MHEDLIFYLIPPRKWKKSQKEGAFHPDSLETEGFIQCLSQREVQPEAGRSFKGERRLLLLVIDTSKVQAAINYPESSEKDSPRIEGPLNLDAVLDRIPLVAEDDGSFEIDIQIE
jgi:uncharacterized protein (DUF952 family)